MNREREELMRLQEYLDRAIARNDPPKKVEKLTRRLEAQQRRVAEIERQEAERVRKREQGISEEPKYAWLMSAFALAAIPRPIENRVRKALWR